MSVSDSEEDIEGLDQSYVVEVDVYAAVMSKDKVSDRIRALNRVGIVVKGIQKPGVLGCDEFTRILIGPELSHAFGSQQVSFWNAEARPSPGHGKKSVAAHLVLVVRM